MRWNKKVITGLATAIVIYLLVPGSVGAALPLLLVAACPLLVLSMMRAISGDRTKPSGENGPADSRATDDEVASLRAQVAELQDCGHHPASSPAHPQAAIRSTGSSPQ